MSKQAELFDGTVLEFEDGTPDHVIERVAREQTDRITTEQARKPLPAGVKPSEGRDTKTTVAEQTPPAPAGPGRTLADIKSTKKAVEQERTAKVPAPPTPPEDLPGGSVLDKPYEGTIPPRMTDEEYQRNYTANEKPKQTFSTPAGTVRNSPIEVQAGDTIRKATGNSLGGAAVQGVAAGLGGLGEAIPGMVAAGADLVGADAVSEFALGAANRAKNFSQAVTPQGGYGNKLVASVFASTVESLPTLAFGLAGGAEVIGGKAVADVAADRAKQLALTELFVQSASKEYADGRNRGLDPGTAAARGGAMGAAEVLGERYGFHEQIAVVRAALGKKNVPTEQLAKVMATEIFKEVPGEELTTAVQFLIDKYGAGGASPKATLADYLEQAMDTAVQTIGQTALMGSPGAVRGTYARADAAIAYDQAALKGFNVTPPYATDPPDTQRKKTIGIFNAAVAQYGIDPEAAKRATEAANSMPAEMVGPFLARMAQALQKRRMVAKPVDEHALDTLTAGPIDDPKVLEAEAKAAETATKEEKPGTIAAPRETAAEEDLTGLSEPSSVDTAAHAAAPSPKNDLPEPTTAQALAGNYQKGHAKVGGLDVSIENPEGSTRRDKNNDPPQWESTMTSAHYGYIRGTVSMDGEHIDTFIKPGTPDAFDGTAFVIDQIDPATGKPDEHKVMIGFETIEEARAAYQANYTKDWKGLGAITAAPMADLKTWLREGDTKKPYGPAQPDVQRTTGQPAAGAAGGSVEPAGSGGTVGRNPADAGRPAENAAAAPVAGSPAAEPVRDGARGAPGAVRVIARAGRMPNSAKPIELRPAGTDGKMLSAWHDGYELVDFETGNPVQIPADATDMQAFEAVKASGAFGKSSKFFGAPKADAAVTTPPAATVAHPDALPKLRERLSGGGNAFIDSDKSGGITHYFAKGLGSVDSKWRVPLALTDEEKKAAKRAEQVADLAETGAERAEAKQALTDALAPAVRRAAGLEAAAPAPITPPADSGVKAPLVKSDKAEMRPYRKPDGSVGYEAVPIVAAEPAQVDETAKVQVDETPNLQSQAPVEPKPPAQPAAQKVAALSDPEAFSDDYASFEGRTVEQTVSISDTGGTALVRIDAAKAMRALDARLKVLTELKGCIGRAA